VVWTPHAGVRPLPRTGDWPGWALYFRSSSNRSTARPFVEARGSEDGCAICIDTNVLLNRRRSRTRRDDRDFVRRLDQDGDDSRDMFPFIA
jgi:hypothetical protein